MVQFHALTCCGDEGRIANDGTLCIFPFDASFSIKAFQSFNLLTVGCRACTHQSAVFGACKHGTLRNPRESQIETLISPAFSIEEFEE